MRLMTEKTYQRLVEDVGERIREDAIGAIRESRERHMEYLRGQVEQFIKDAVANHISGESFLDSIVDRIMRKQLTPAAPTRTPGLRRASE